MPDHAEYVRSFPHEPFQKVHTLDPASLAPGRHALGVVLTQDPIARDIYCPVIVLKGAQPGPVFGLTAAVHGNELNGIPTIHRLFRTIDPAELKGTLVGATVLNVPGYIRCDRRFPDARDLNRLMPGRANGRESDVYVYRLAERILAHFDMLIDLHTASFGRVNTLYVRADMRDPGTARIARALGAEIIVHNEGRDGTVRAQVADRGVPAITVEIGDPQVIDRAKVRQSRIGIRDVLEAVGMVPPDGQAASGEAIECARSYWLYTDTGGLLDVVAPLGERVKAGDTLANLVDPWGRKLRSYHAPEDGVVVGKSTNPVASTGARIMHLGIEGKLG